MKHVRVILFLVSGIALVLLSLSAGTTMVSPVEVARSIFGFGSPSAEAILFSIRLPRVLMSLLVGSSLAVSGAIFQAVLKNPLADPYLVGVSGGGALGATVAIVLSLSFPLVVASAFLGSIAAVSAVYLMSRRMGFGTVSLILSGVALGFIFTSSVLLIFSLAGSDRVHRALMWLMGDLSIARMDLIPEMGLISLSLGSAAMLLHRHLDVVSFGESFSSNLGVTTRSLRVLFWSASLLAAVSVSLCGVIGFVGLVVPHLMRMLFGPRHRRLIPASFLGGGLFLMASDAVGRSIAPPYEIPVGVITGFFGGIFFIAYMIAKRECRT